MQLLGHSFSVDAAGCCSRPGRGPAAAAARCRGPVGTKREKHVDHYLVKHGGPKTENILVAYWLARGDSFAVHQFRARAQHYSMIRI